MKWRSVMAQNMLRFAIVVWYRCATHSLLPCLYSSPEVAAATVASTTRPLHLFYYYRYFSTQQRQNLATCHMSHATGIKVTRHRTAGTRLPTRTPCKRTFSSEVADDSSYFNLDAVENAAFQAQAIRRGKHLLKISSSPYVYKSLLQKQNLEF
jgi:hypothetical protein